MNTDKTKTPENSNNGVGRLNKLAYRDGYLYGRAVEHDIQDNQQIIRENNSAAKGLLMGITIAAIAGILGATISFVNHSNQRSTTPGETTPVPNNIQP